MSGSEALVAAARAAREHAQAAYSGFRVGAALECADGTIVTGCNIENATYGLTVCAERVALWKALSEGRTGLRPPRRRRRHRAADAAVRRVPAAAVGVLRRHRDRARQPRSDETGRHRLADLLPMPFDRSLLGTDG